MIKNKEYIYHRFKIELNKKDIQLIYKIKTIIGVGKVRITKNNTVEFVINDMNHLINYIIPIFDKYPCITRKKFQYDIWKDTLLEKKIGNPLRIKPEYINDIANDTKTIDEILKLSYFDNWLIGFTEAEGSFSISNENDGKRIRPYFSINQKYDYYIIEAIRIKLNFNCKVLVRKDNMYMLSAKSKREIENVIKFYSKVEIKLLGYKGLQFRLWIKEIGKLENYLYIKLPYNY